MSFKVRPDLSSKVLPGFLKPVNLSTNCLCDFHVNGESAFKCVSEKEYVAREKKNSVAVGKSFIIFIYYFF